MLTAVSCSHSSRRQFLKAAGAVAIAAAVSPAPGAAPEPAMHVGILLGTFRGSLEEKLDKAKAAGIPAVQSSMDCAGLSDMPDAIAPELADRIARLAAERSLAIASVQGTFNMAHPDPEHRQAGLRRLRVLAEACPRLKTSKIHLCSGTRDRGSMWRRHPDNDTPEAWRDMAACMREAAAIAKGANVVLAFEPEVNNVVDSAVKARRLMDEVGSDRLKVTIDGANIFHKGELPKMREMLEQAFELIGKDVALAHAKDLDHDGDAGHLAAGKGRLDYNLYISLLRRAGYRGPVLLHGLSEAQVPDCVAFLRERMGP